MIREYQKRLDAAKRDLAHVVGTMTLFEASGDLKAIGAHHAIVRMFRRGEMFTANRHEFARVKAQLERESFAETAVQAAEAATAQRKAYGNRRGNVLEGTTFEKKDEPFGGGRGG